MSSTLQAKLNQNFQLRNDESRRVLSAISFLFVYYEY